MRVGGDAFEGFGIQLLPWFEEQFLGNRIGESRVSMCISISSLKCGHTRVFKRGHKGTEIFG
jgi:hypothetical protein